MAPHCLPGDGTINVQISAVNLEATPSMGKCAWNKWKSSPRRRTQLDLHGARGDRMPTTVNKESIVRQTRVEKMTSERSMILRKIKPRSEDKHEFSDV